MERKDIEHLATLARIALTETESDELAADITNILGYVSEINEITGDSEVKKEVGAHFNVFREDGEPHAPNLYTDALLETAPDTQGKYLRVKKILGEK